MTDTPLHRAARALMKSQSGVDDFEALDDEMQAGLLDDVRAVLEAVKEPSKRMQSDGAFRIFRGERITEDDLSIARHAWRAMIDATLSE